MNSQTKKGMMKWRALSILTIMAVMLSAAPSAVAMESNTPTVQGKNPQESTSTTFEITGSTVSNNPILPNAAQFGGSLYDQLDNFAYTAAIAQDYGDATNKWDTEVADDFVVPAADGIWELKTIELYGACERGYCPSFTANINIYTNDGILPGQTIYNAPSQAIYSDYSFYGTTINHYIIDLSTPAILPPGTYWISIQINMGADWGNFGWLERSVQTGNWHAFRNPGGGWHEGCLTWCTGHPKYPDLAFKLNGNTGGNSKLSISVGMFNNIYAVAEHGTKPLVYISIPDENSVYVINTQSGEIQATIPVGISPEGLAISPDSSRVFVAFYADNQRKISVIDTSTNSVILTFPITNENYIYPKDLVYGGPGRLYILANGIKSFNPTNGDLVTTLPAVTGEWLSVSRDQKILCGSSRWTPSQISCYDISTDNPPAPWTNPNVCDNVETIDVSSDGTKIYVTCEGDIRVFDLATLTQTNQFNNGTTFNSAYSTPDGQFLFGAGSSDLWLMDADSHLPIRSLDHTGNIKLLKAGQDNHTVYATSTAIGGQYLYIYHFSYFRDVYWKYWAQSWIERLYNAQITGGCGNTPLIYCPETSVTRAQMAVFLERGMNGASFTPPVASGTIFGDIPNDHWAAAWIEQLAADGVTGGCGGGNYCPDMPVTRAQMAVFLLRAVHGSAYEPPAPSGVFADVPTTYWAAAWIEQLAVEGITSGCGNGNFCPDLPVTRAQMAVFLVKTFNLP